MGTKRTHEPGVWIDILKAEDLDYIACGSYFIITVDGRRVPGGYGVPLPSSGRVPIGTLTCEIARAKAWRAATASA